MQEYTVVGVDGSTLKRYLEIFYACDSIHAEKQACLLNPDLLVAGVFQGALEPADQHCYAPVF